MNIQGIIFDINGTLINIHTDETYNEIYRVISNFLRYQGISLPTEPVRDLYFRHMKRQRRTSAEDYPEFDVVKIFRTMLAEHATAYTKALPPEKLEQLPVVLAEMYRAISMFRLELYPGVREVLGKLRPTYRLAALSDAQSPWAAAELHATGLLDFFPHRVVSGDLGFRKPDRRIFELALNDMGLSADQVLFVGNDMFRDIHGARDLGIKNVFFRSNQGGQYYHGVEPDYVIYNFPELLQAIEFFKRNA